MHVKKYIDLVFRVSHGHLNTLMTPPLFRIVDCSVGHIGTQSHAYEKTVRIPVDW